MSGSIMYVIMSCDNHLFHRKKGSAESFLTLYAYYFAQHHMVTGLIIMTSHRTSSGQNKYMSGQFNFGQTNLLYITNGNVIEFVKNNECLNNFWSLSYTMMCHKYHTLILITHQSVRRWWRRQLQEHQQVVELPTPSDMFYTYVGTYVCITDKVST